MKIGQYNYREFNQLIQSMTRPLEANYYLQVDLINKSSSVLRFEFGSENTPHTYWSSTLNEPLPSPHNATHINVLVDGVYNIENLINTADKFLRSADESTVVAWGDLVLLIAGLDDLYLLFTSEANEHARFQFQSNDIEEKTVTFKMLGELWTFPFHHEETYDDLELILCDPESSEPAFEFGYLKKHPMMYDDFVEKSLLDAFNKIKWNIMFEYKLSIVLDITQEEFCGKVGVTRQGVAKWKKTKFPEWVWLALRGIEYNQLRGE